jgi:HlyD family secretion protein
MRKIFWAMIALCLAMGLGACRRKADTIQAPGTVRGEVATVRTLVAGTLDQWTSAEGQRLRRGETMGALNQDRIVNGLEELDLAAEEIQNQESRLRKKLTALRANADYLRRQTERLERLEKEAAVAGDQVDKSRLHLLEAETALFEAEKALAGLDIQKDKLRNKRRSLELTRRDFIILSPVNGVVLETFVCGGESLLPGAALADVLDEDSLYIEVFLEEREIGRLRLGDTAQVRLDGLPGRPLAGTVTFFGRQAEFSPKYVLSEKEREALLFEVKVKVQGETSVLKESLPVTVVFRPQ